MEATYRKMKIQKNNIFKVKNRSAWPMNEADWESLRDFALNSDLPKTHLLYSKAFIRRVFSFFREKGWKLETKTTFPYASTAKIIKKTLRISFEDLPKHLHTPGIGGVVVRWRLTVNK